MAAKKTEEKAVEEKTEETAVEVSEKKRLIAVLLNMFFGWMGAHRFYTGQTKTAVLMMFTGGGFGMAWFYDFVMLLLGKYKDQQDHVVSAWT